jgi:glycosyltransferase involved in cell wall biosynthesis
MSGEMTRRNVPLRSGVSVIICCYNSAARLPETLAHLARQTGAPDWELIVVNNASTDDTEGVARECWGSQRVPLQIVHEPNPGLMHARKAGLRVSSCEVISFIDDDNWVCSDWLRRVWEIFSTQPDTGACGGVGEPVLEESPPEWFERYGPWFAVGPQAPETGYMEVPPRHLYGAGLNFRRAALDRLEDGGFHSLLVGRTKGNLSSGEDAELCLALGLSGWKLWYDTGLSLKHYLPRRRVQWAYMRALQRAIGDASVWLDAYRSFNGEGRLRWKRRIRRSWLWQSQETLRKLWQLRRYLRRYTDPALEGDDHVLDTEFYLGRLRALTRVAFSYDLRMWSLESAQWRTRGLSVGIRV